MTDSANRTPSLRVLLVGNYPDDRPESMLRFADVLQRHLRERGIEAAIVSPRSVFGRFGWKDGSLAKWLGYVDKHLIFPFALRKAIATARRQSCSLSIHICDHSNAMYTMYCGNLPVAVTCHDLLAVRGALGEQTDCPASRTGRILQRWILRGLAGATRLVCDSTATLHDVERLVAGSAGKTRLVLLGLNHHFKTLAPSLCGELLARVPGLNPLFADSPTPRPYLLHVGSSLRRKNRDGAIRILRRLRDRWDGVLVFAGAPLSPEYRDLARELGLESRILEVVQPGDAVLEALYNRAFGLLFPSRFEGFGWPVIEAQACGCPVICSDSGPLPEVAGDGAIVCDVQDEAAFAEAVLRLVDPAVRRCAVEKGLANVRRFTTERMVSEYVEVYAEMSFRRNTLDIPNAGSMFDKCD